MTNNLWIVGIISLVLVTTLLILSASGVFTTTTTTSSKLTKEKLQDLIKNKKDVRNVNVSEIIIQKKIIHASDHSTSSPHGNK